MIRNVIRCICWTPERPGTPIPGLPGRNVLPALLRCIHALDQLLGRLQMLLTARQSRAYRSVTMNAHSEARYYARYYYGVPATGYRGGRLRA